MTLPLRGGLTHIPDARANARIASGVAVEPHHLAVLGDPALDVGVDQGRPLFVPAVVVRFLGQMLAAGSNTRPSSPTIGGEVRAGVQPEMQLRSTHSRSEWIDPPHLPGWAHQPSCG